MVFILFFECVSSCSLKVNNEVIPLPYTTANKQLIAYQDGIYVVIDTKAFTIMFGGKQYLKFFECSLEVCGICGNDNKNPSDDVDFEDFIVKDSSRKCFPDNN